VVVLRGRCSPRHVTGPSLLSEAVLRGPTCCLKAECIYSCMILYHHKNISDTLHGAFGETWPVRSDNKVKLGRTEVSTCFWFRFLFFRRECVELRHHLMGSISVVLRAEMMLIVWWRWMLLMAKWLCLCCGRSSLTLTLLRLACICVLVVLFIPCRSWPTSDFQHLRKSSGSCELWF